jgi:UPF0755 protein
VLETLPKRTDSRPRHPRRRGLIVLVVLFVLLAALAGGFGSYYRWATGASGPQTPVLVDIPPGATGAQVADILKANGVIRSAFAFRMLAKFRGHGAGFDAGQYRMTTNMTVSAALDALEQPPAVHAIRVTIPEGFTVSGTAARIGKAIGTSPSAIAAAANSGTYSLPPFLPAGSKTTEGFLFPNTYDFLHAESPSAVVNRLLGEFRVEANTLPWANAKKLGVTPYQVVIIASMIEREAKFQSDRGKIARVIYNRLAKGMYLQIDATVEYALGSHKATLTNADLAVNSPYNTYLHKGLPPTPIANPGLASLKAALSPTNGNWLYYVLIDKAGHHAFTASYQEFLHLKAQYVG